ncbi:hypothetical protein TIFTF001_012882 [Ficus carica]|uniref:Uncharacterized protein n=1 Tax=Ficus carica TaxID=3494 RepID=A0AA87ZZU8_FICCA|nr:hypothetical protein TIFTF001_012882 [Ficus carica]
MEGGRGVERESFSIVWLEGNDEGEERYQPRDSLLANGVPPRVEGSPGQWVCCRLSELACAHLGSWGAKALKQSQSLQIVISQTQRPQSNWKGEEKKPRVQPSNPGDL